MGEGQVQWIKKEEEVKDDGSVGNKEGLDTEGGTVFYASS